MPESQTTMMAIDPAEYDALAAAAVRITRGMEVSHVVNEIAAQARTLSGASASRVEISRDRFDREPLRVVSGDPGSAERKADLVVEMQTEDRKRLGSIEIWF